MLRLWETGGESAWIDSFRHRMLFRPRYSEIDSYGHVGNVVYPTIFEAGRMEYLADVGDPEWHEGLIFAFGHVVAEQHVRYIARCFFNEEYNVLTKIGELGHSSATMEQAIVGPDGSLRAIARTVIVHNDGHETKPWTDAQSRAISEYEGFVTAAVREF